MNTYDPIKHEYFLDGVKVPSVTGVLPEQKFFVSDDRLAELAEEGEDNHDLIKMYFDMGEPGSNPMLIALDRWLSEHPEIGAIVKYETPLFSVKQRYAGTPDAIFEKAVIDFKRSYGNKKIHALQLAGYHRLALENQVIKKTRQWLIMVFDGDRFTTRNVYDERAENIFSCLVKKYHIEKEVAQWMSNN